MTRRSPAILLMLCLLGGPALGSSAPWPDPSAHRSAFITTNGVRLNYLDWGGRGPALILIHGLGDNPHIFDDLAPGLTDRFHVIAYARRAHGLSETKPPYDTVTLTEDLLGLMDALRIRKADLVGWSMGGDEITSMAIAHPERVDRIVYFDALYDYADPDFGTTFRAAPMALLEPTARDLASLDAYRSYQHRVAFAGLKDMRRVEAYVRQLVIVQPDGSVRERMPKKVEKALVASLSANPPRDYKHVGCPALAIDAGTAFDRPIADPAVRTAILRWERRYWTPFRDESVERARRQLAHLRIITLRGGHTDFFLVSRQRVLAAMRQFLLADAAKAPKLNTARLGASSAGGNSAETDK